MRESALWRSLKKCVPRNYAMAERIENSVNSSMPDVLMTSGSRTFLVELKVGWKNVTPAQKNWARRWAKAGGTSWFLIREGDALYLIPGYAEIKLITRWRVEDCREAMKIMLNAVRLP